MRSVDMDFHYRILVRRAAAGRLRAAAAGCAGGDASLFTRSDSIEAAWRLLDPILQGWVTKGTPSLVVYPAGSWGPAEADHLLKRDGREWRLGCVDEPGIIHMG